MKSEVAKSYTDVSVPNYLLQVRQTLLTEHHNKTTPFTLPRNTHKQIQPSVKERTQNFLSPLC